MFFISAAIIDIYQIYSIVIQSINGYSLGMELEQKCYSVSEITNLIRSMLEEEFHNITVEGEISNFRPSSTGHYYFSLKDREAIISVVMFKNRINSLSFKPEDGMKVKAGGNISVYAKRGNYQLICETLTKSGEGDLLAMLEERKKKLAASGLFDQDRKKPIPMFPSRIAVITSPTGAAIRDILRVLGRRHAGINLVILPAPVQGEGAADIIAQRIRTANRYAMAEVIIVGRGGGSLEDLLPFYDEAVVYAIAESEIPVISSVGHEIDFTLSDLAADLRAPTPSAAAELVSASRVELARRVQELESTISESIFQRLERNRLIISQFSPENLIRNFKLILQPYLLNLDEARESLIGGMNKLLLENRHKLEILSNSIQSHSPLEILKRGYAVVVHEITKKALSSTESVSINDNLDVRFYRGRLKATVKEKFE